MSMKGGGFFALFFYAEKQPLVRRSKV